MLSLTDGPHLPRRLLLSRLQAAITKIQNFRQVQQALVDLGVTFDSRLANAVITKKPGVALNLIYQIKLAIGSVRGYFETPRVDATLA